MERRVSATLSKVVPALLIGCSIAVKPSPGTPLGAMLLAQLVEVAGFPEGFASILAAG
jgi:acyl-CoA reductase-like NAD-dependent aldehyde dehydrogenase